MIKHIRKWLEWRKGNINPWFHQILVLLCVIRSPTFCGFITKAEWKEIGLAFEAGIRAADLFSESVKLAEQSLQSFREEFKMRQDLIDDQENGGWIKPPAVLYLCDQKACTDATACQEICFYTSDITHAANFQPGDLGGYWETGGDNKGEKIMEEN